MSPSDLLITGLSSASVHSNMFSIDGSSISSTSSAASYSIAVLSYRSTVSLREQPNSCALTACSGMPAKYSLNDLPWLSAILASLLTVSSRS